MADWNSIYGLNKGAAQVLQGNAGLDALRQQYALHQQQKAKDEADFNSNLAKINFKGAANADLPVLQEKMQNIMNTHAGMRAMTNPKDRLAMAQKLQEQQQDALFAANQSVENNKFNQKVYDLALSGKDLSDEYHPFAKKLMTTQTIGDNNSAYQDFLSKGVGNIYNPKPIDLNNISKKEFDAVTAPINKNDIRVPLKGGGDQVVSFKGKQTGYDDFNNRMLNYFTANPKAIKQVMTQTGIDDPSEAVKQYTKQSYDVYNKANGEVKHFGTMNKPDNYLNHLLLREKYGSSGATGETPAQILITGDPSRGISGMQQMGAGTGEKFISLAPKGQYGDKKPVIGVDNATGEHIFQFPDIVKADKSNIEFNKKLRENYQNDPETKRGIFGMGSKPIPFEQSSVYDQRKPETVMVHPAKVYKLNPASPDYLAQAAQMAKDQNINLGQLNQIEGKKGNRGQIPQAVKQTTVNPVNKHKKAASDYGL